MDIQTLRSYRVTDMALFDWITSLLAAARIGHYLFHLDSPVAWVAFIFA